MPPVRATLFRSETRVLRRTAEPRAPIKHKTGTTYCPTPANVRPSIGPTIADNPCAVVTGAVSKGAVATECKKSN